jgi:gas vesicle structural protein
MGGRAAMSSGDLVTAGRNVTLVELVDRLLGKGVVIAGDITLAVADIDLVTVELRALVASTDTLARRPGVAE